MSTPDSALYISLLFLRFFFASPAASWYVEGFLYTSPIPGLFFSHSRLPPPPFLPTRAFFLQCHLLVDVLVALLGGARWCRPQYLSTPPTPAAGGNSTHALLSATAPLFHLLAPPPFPFGYSLFLCTDNLGSPRLTSRSVALCTLYCTLPLPVPVRHQRFWPRRFMLANIPSPHTPTVRHTPISPLSPYVPQFHDSPAS